MLVISAAADATSIVAVAGLFRALANAGSPTAALIFFASAIIAAGGLRTGLALMTEHWALMTVRDLSVAIQRRVLALPYEAHFARHSSALIAVTEKVEQIVLGLMVPLIQSSGAVVSGVFILIGLMAIDAEIAVAVLAALAALFGLSNLLTKGMLSRAGAEAANAYDDRVRAVQESIGGIRDVILDDTAPLHVAKFDGIATRLARSTFRITSLSTLPRQAIEAIGILALAALAVSLAGRSGAIGEALPTLAALALAAQRLLPAAHTIFQAYARSSSSRRHVSDVFAFLRLPEPHVPIDTGQAPAFRSTIEFRNVGYRYPDRDRDAVRDISLTIRKGERIVLTGQSGAGKSTLADLLMGLLIPGCGEIMVDGVRLDPADLAHWRGSVAHVPQRPFLIDDSLAQNIALSSGGGAIDRVRLDHAIQVAGLSDLIARLPKGPETALGEHAVRLSGGERQRVALARAIYRAAPLLVLDEATNALDDQTEALVVKGFDQLKREGFTVVVIAHRGQALDNADRVFRFVDGEVEELLTLVPGLEHEDCP